MSSEETGSQRASGVGARRSSSWYQRSRPAACRCRRPVPRATTITFSTVGHSRTAASTIGLQIDDLPAILVAVRADDDALRLGLLDAVQRLRGRSRRRRRSGPRRSGSRRASRDLLGDFGHVDAGAVALLEAKLRQYVRELRRLAPDVGVGERAGRAVLTLPVVGDLVPDGRPMCRSRQL